MTKRIIIFLVLITILFISAGATLKFSVAQFGSSERVFYPGPSRSSWEVQSIDTMKYSRDLAAEKIDDENFINEIDWQISEIAKTGATHAAVATPYDKEFFPFLELWVESARKHDLNVWFRGNWSAWEGWFGYSDGMTRQEHIEKTVEFILGHPNLFSDGDVFSSCPECENGGPGDPRHNNDLSGYRKFLIDEYSASKEAFGAINKKVDTNYFSMNGDVARLVMDKATTEALDGIVVIDHYVASPEQLVSDIKKISSDSGGKVVLGEWGVPIPDIHGTMTQKERAQWMESALDGMIALDGVLEGMNYWLAVGGSAALWKQGDENSETAEVLKKYYIPHVVFGRILNELGEPIGGARIAIGGKEVFSREDGYFEWSSVNMATTLEVTAESYLPSKMEISEIKGQTDITLKKEHKGFYMMFKLWLKRHF